MILKSPTGSWKIRSDAMGSGLYGAARGSRKHKGIDLVVEGKQVIDSPITGKVIREAYPYAGDLKWTGCQIIGTHEHKGLDVKLFYMKLYSWVLKRIKEEGQFYCHAGLPIGLAQLISHRHGEVMIDHVHFEIKQDVCTQVQLDPEKYKEGE